MTRYLLPLFCLLLAASAVFADNAVQRDIIIGEKRLIPQTLDVDAAGNVYVGGGEEVWVYDKDGNRTAVWQFSAARPVRVGPGGNIYLGRTWEPDTQVRCLDPRGKQLASIGVNKWLHGDAVGFEVPFDLLFDPDGNMWSVNTYHTAQDERRKDTLNTAWGGRREDPNGSRLMCFDLRQDPAGRAPKYFGTFSNTPPEQGGPADGLHRPRRLTFDAVHKKLFVLDDWGVTRWSWPDGAFEGRIIRTGTDYNNALLAATPQGTLFIRLTGNTLGEYDDAGKKLADHPEYDLYGARDMRVTADGALYLCYPDARICYKHYTPAGKLALCRGLNMVTLRLATEQSVYDAGATIPLTAHVEDRRSLYGQAMPELAELGRSLWYRPYRPGATWKPLPIQPGPNGQGEQVTLPADLTGALQLRLSTSAVAPELLDESGAYVEINLALRAPHAGWSLTVTPDRGQTLCCAGEWVRVNVVGRTQAAVAPETLHLRLLSPDGAKSTVLADVSSHWQLAAQGTATAAFDLWVPTVTTPQPCRLVALSPALGQADCALTVAPAREAGNFKLFVALGLGYRFSPAATAAYVAQAVRLGVTHDVTRYISADFDYGTNGEEELRTNAQLRALLNTDPRLPAAEAADLPTRRRAALAQMGAAGLRLWPEMMGWELDTVNRTEKQAIQDRQNLAKWTLWGAKSPAQDGFLWNESNWWGVDHTRLQAAWSAATHKAPEQLRGLDWGRLQEYTPLLTGDRLADALDYHAYMAKELYPRYYHDWKSYAETIRPSVTGAGVPALYPINWPTWCAQQLDGVMSYHQVEQVCEPYMQLNDGAFMRPDGRPFWAGVEMIPDPGTGEYLARQLLPALFYGAEGFWANDMGNFRSFMSIANAGQTVRAAQRAQAAGDLRAVLEPVGTRLRRTRLRALFGIYCPRAAFVQQGNPAFRGDSYTKRVSAALIASYHAHLPARIVFDDELPTVTDVRYLLLPGLQSEIPAADRAALAAYGKAGGTVLLGAHCADAYLPLGKAIDVDFSIFKDDDYVDWFTQDSRVEKRRRVLALATAMQQALAPYLRPPVRLDDPDIWYAFRDGQDDSGKPLTYFIAVNQNFPKNLTMAQLWKMTSSYSAVLPVLREATLPAGYKYAYDLLGGNALTLTNGKLPLDFRHFPARVFLLSPTSLAPANPPTPPPSAHAVKLAEAPAVDIFFEQRIRAALRDGKELYVIGREPQRTRIIDSLKTVGVGALASVKVEDEDGVHLVLPAPGDDYWHDENDVLPVRLTENVPGPGRALLTYLPACLPAARDAILLAATDDAGFATGLDTLTRLARPSTTSKALPEQRLTAPTFRPALPAPLHVDATRAWGARLTVVRAAGDTVAVGAAEWGNNLFLLDRATGAVRAAAKAGRFYVDDLWLTADGKQAGAEALYPEDVNGYLELFDGQGKSSARYARDGVDSHANFNYFDHTTRTDIFSFALAPDGSVVYTSSNLGISALQRDGTRRWRIDVAQGNTGLEDLRNKWAGRLDLTPDGRTLAVGLTHELYHGPDGPYRGCNKVLQVEALTGKVRWTVQLDPIEDPALVDVKCAPDGQTIAVLDSYYGLLLLRDGKIIKQRRGDFTRLAWSADGQRLFALVRKDSQDAVLALTADGVPVWQFDQPLPIIGLAPAPARQVAFTDASRRVVLLSAAGTPVWEATLEATGSITTDAQAVYACDWHGNVSCFALDDGRRGWTQNLTACTWRADMETLPTTPYAGATFGLPQRATVETPPPPGENLAPQAAVRAGGTGGWFSTDRVLIDAHTLTDGHLDDQPTPWLSPTDQYKAGNWSRIVWAEFTWPHPVTIAGLQVHEDARHPECFPYDVCVQVWQENAWRDVAVFQTLPGTPWRWLALPTPLHADKIRYVITGALVNNVRTDEIRVIGQ